MEKELNDYLEKVEKHLKPLRFLSGSILYRRLKAKFWSFAGRGGAPRIFSPGWGIPGNWQRPTWEI